MRSWLLLALAASAHGDSHNHLAINLTELGSCFSPYIYNLVLNAASAADLSAATALGANVTSDFNADSNFTKSSDYRITLDAGTKAGTIVTLFVIGAVSLLLLIAGEALVTTLTVLTSTLVSFMGFLFLWQWACSSMESPMEGWVKCLLPFILACACAAIIGSLVICLIRKFTWLVFFVMGAAGGACGMFLLRQFILAGNPHLSGQGQSLFNLYWLGLAGVAILCGLFAVCLKRSVITAVTCILGGYGFAIALCGLIPAFDGPYVPNWGFFVTAGLTMILGAVFQCFCCKADPEKKARMEQYRADADTRKKNAANAKKAGDGVVLMAP